MRLLVLLAWFVTLAAFWTGHAEWWAFAIATVLIPVTFETARGT